MHNNNETEQRIADLKAQIALIKQDREDIHQAIVERTWSVGIEKGTIRRVILAMAMPMLAAFGILIGILIMEARAGDAAIEPVNQPVDMPVSEQEDPGYPETPPQAMDEHHEKTVDTGSSSNTKVKHPKKGAKNNRGKNTGGRKVIKNKPEKKEDIFDVLDKCGDDPMCGDLLDKK